MSKKVKVIALLFLLVGLALYFIPDVQARVETILWNTALKGTLTKGGEKPYKYHYFPFGTNGAGDRETTDIGGGAEILNSSGLTGVNEVGSTTGYIQMNEDADILRFRFHLPETYVDTGSAGDLKLQFYVDEQVTIDAATYDVNIYEFNNASPILTDQFTVKYGDAAGWVDLVTNSAGIGDDGDIDEDDILVITISPQTNLPVGATHKVNIYGMRIRYRPGLHSTN